MDVLRRVQIHLKCRHHLIGIQRLFHLKLDDATQPNAGAQDMALVAGCVGTDAKSWKLPAVANGKGAAGTTRIKLTYNTAPKK